MATTSELLGWATTVRDFMLQTALRKKETISEGSYTVAYRKLFSHPEADKAVKSWLRHESVIGIQVLYSGRSREDIEDAIETGYKPLFEMLQARRVAEDEAAVKPPDVFIVHGHDHSLRDKLVDWVRESGFEPHVLADKPGMGRPLIQKFEETADVDYAIVIMTPDDVGGLPDASSLPRARQNVIFELGYFVCKLGRSHVALLVVGDIEKPSDYGDVSFVRYDGPSGKWRDKLREEMAAVNVKGRPTTTA